jgi:hypothetical protein
MATVERVFVLQCPCAGRVTVTAGQAGGQASCPDCGRAIDVPRLRDLAAYAVAPAAVVGPPRWGLGRGLLVAGSALGVAAAILALSLVPVGGLFFPQPPTVAQIRAAVATAPLAQVYEGWQSMARSGVGRPPSQEELRLQQFAANAVTVGRLLWGVSGIGLVMALVGAALAATGRSAGGGPPR